MVPSWHGDKQNLEAIAVLFRRNFSICELQSLTEQQPKRWLFAVYRLWLVNLPPLTILATREDAYMWRCLYMCIYTRWLVSNIFYFHPNPWGKDPIWRAYFSNGVAQPPPIIELWAIIFTFTVNMENPNHPTCVTSTTTYWQLSDAGLSAIWFADKANKMKLGQRSNNWVVVSKISYFYQYLGKWSNLTSTFFQWVGSTTN